MMNCKLSNFFIYFLFFLLFISIFNFSGVTISLYGSEIAKEPIMSVQIRKPIKPVLPYLSPKTDLQTRIINYISGYKVTMNYDGLKKEIYSEPCKIIELLSKQDIKLSQYDEIQPKINDYINNNQKIIIKRILFKQYTVDYPINYDVVKEFNPIVEEGLTVVWVPGEEGTLKKCYKDKYEDGVLIKRELLWQKNIKSPVNEVLAVGTAVFNGKYIKKIRMLASSYNPTVEQCGPNPFITATGKRVSYGYVAVDPRFIPLGTRMYVSGYGYAVAEDTGGLIINTRIDLFFWRRCPEWRGGYINVYILE
jgi:3D (Asp-Asp-Asp) domain-containing protein